MKEIGDIGVAGNEDNQLPWGNGQSVGRALPLKPKVLEHGLEFETLNHFKPPEQDACADVLIRGLPAHEERSGNCPAR